MFKVLAIPSTKLSQMARRKGVTYTPPYKESIRGVLGQWGLGDSLRFLTCFRKTKSHTLRTVDTPKGGVKKSLFFDNQKQAASVLGISIDLLRDWKGEGCTAFRSGRIYREELEIWMREKGIRGAAGAPRRLYPRSVQQILDDESEMTWREVHRFPVGTLTGRALALAAQLDGLSLCYFEETMDLTGFGDVLRLAAESVLQNAEKLGLAAELLPYIENWKHEMNGLCGPFWGEHGQAIAKKTVKRQK